MARRRRVRAGRRRTPEPPSRAVAAARRRRLLRARVAPPLPLPFPSPPSPGLPRPRRTAGLVTRELPPPRSIFFFSPQPATACARPPASSSRSAGQLQPDKGTRGTRGLAYTREGCGRAQAAERIPAPRKLRAPPSRRSPRRSRGKLSPCPGSGGVRHCVTGAPGWLSGARGGRAPSRADAGEPRPAAGVSCSVLSRCHRRGPAGPGGRGGCAEASGRTSRPFCSRELSGGGRGRPAWPRPACGVALAAGELRVETAVGASLGRRSAEALFLFITIIISPASRLQLRVPHGGRVCLATVHFLSEPGSSCEPGTFLQPRRPFWSLISKTSLIIPLETHRDRFLFIDVDFLLYFILFYSCRSDPPVGLWL